MKKKHLKKLKHHKIVKHHPKKLFRKNIYLGLILKTLLITLLLIAGYYFLFLKPKLAISNELAETEKNLSVRYFELIQNRIAYTELVKLDTSSGNFEYAKEEILARIQKSNEEGLKELENPVKLEKINGFPNATLNFINNDLNSAYSDLLEKSEKNYEEQKKVIEKLTTFDSASSKLFAYNPQLDLGKLDPRKDKEEFLERIGRAKNGLRAVQEGLDKNSKLYKEIDDTLSALIVTENNVQKGNIVSSPKALIGLYNQFSEVKNEALLSLQSIIRSPESVKLLTEQTNLILEYEFWLGKINQK